MIDLIDRKDLVAAQQEIEGVKGHILRIERDLAKERAEAERVKADLVQALDESYVDIEHTLVEVEVR